MSMFLVDFISKFNKCLFVTKGELRKVYTVTKCSRGSCHIGGSVEGGVFKPSAHNALCQVNLRAIIFHYF